MNCDKCGREVSVIVSKGIKVVVDPHPYFEEGLPKDKVVTNVFGGSGLKSEVKSNSFGYIEHDLICEGKK